MTAFSRTRIQPWHLNAALAAVMLCLAGCEPYRIEYHTRPAYYDKAAVGELPDRVTLDDGTVIVYRNDDAAVEKQDEQRKEFKIREERDDGTIALRALIPEHVIANTLECLENEEYELLYNELLSERTRLEWEGLGNDVNDFAAHFANNRSQMIRALTRIYIGISQLETVMEEYDNGVIECRLRQRSAKSMPFSRVRVIREGFGLKLLTIR